MLISECASPSRWALGLVFCELINAGALRTWQLGLTFLLHLDSLWVCAIKRCINCLLRSPLTGALVTATSVPADSVGMVLWKYWVWPLPRCPAPYERVPQLIPPPHPWRLPHVHHLLQVWCPSCIKCLQVWYLLWPCAGVDELFSPEGG